MDYKRESHDVIVIDGIRLELPSRVLAEVALPDRVVILLSPSRWADDDPARTRTVWCYGPGAKPMWQIQDPGVRAKDIDGKSIYGGYSALYLDGTTHELWACTSRMCFVIDKDTGKIVRSVIDDR